jgi:DNA-binding CsgD family transcriptional regulator
LSPRDADDVQPTPRVQLRNPAWNHGFCVMRGPFGKTAVTDARTTSSRLSTSGATLLCDRAWDDLQDRLRLSGRELQIIKAVFEGWPESAIAVHLGMSPHTVHTHMERLHHKLDVKDRVGLVLRIVSTYLRLRGPIAASSPGSRHATRALSAGVP